MTSPRTRFARHRALLASACIAGLLTLAGCSGGSPSDDPTPIMPTSTSPTTEPTPTGPVEPTPPPELEGDDAAAAEAFVRYYISQLSYAQATGSVDSLKSTALESCDACRGSLEAIESIHATGKVEGGHYTVRSVGASMQGTFPGGGITYAARARVHHTAQVVTGARDKALDGNFPAGTDRFQFLIVKKRGTWQVAKWDLL